MFERKENRFELLKAQFQFVIKRIGNLRTCGLVGETIKDEGVGVNDVVFCSAQPFSEY